MRICPKCYAENADTAKVCTGCAEPLQQSGGKTCPAGRHTMDPNWTECVYCKTENPAMGGPLGGSRTPTVLEGATPSGSRPATVFEGAGPVGNRPATVFEGTAPTGNRPATMVEGASPAGNRPAPFVETKYEPGGGGGGRPLPPRPGLGVPSPPAPPPAPPAGTRARPREHTVFRPVQGSSEPTPSVPSVAKDRKIVGILVTYSWRREGQVFHILEGRNFIGREKECEICVPEDETLSGKNSHITFRQNFVIGDMVSMTGTDLNGVPNEQQFCALSNYATIRAGSTYFTFIAIEPPPAPAAPGPPTT